MLPRLAWAFALLSTSLASPVSIEPQNTVWDYYCGRDTYGLPNIEDCHPLLESFANHRDNVLRAFDEEQMRVDHTGSWPGVGGVQISYLDRVVQVPRYYTSNSCNFAIMSYTSGNTAMQALGGTSWAQVNTGGNFMMTKCLLNKPLASGGVIVIPSTHQHGQSVVSLFMWESGSVFELILNSFSNDPAPIIPAPGNSLVVNGTVVNTTGLSPTMLGAFHAAFVDSGERSSE